MEDSILKSIKQLLGLGADYTPFDLEITLHINSVFSTLTQLGVGPSVGFEIEDDEALWDDFLNGDSRYSTVKSYIYLRVRLLFDPPATSFAIDSMNKQLEQMEWRLNVTREEDSWVSPFPPITTETV